MRKALEEERGEKEPKKSFKDYEPGFIHIDIEYLPKMADETTLCSDRQGFKMGSFRHIS